jgi:hypothetical protein
MKQELTTQPSPPPLLHVITVEDEELHPVTRAYGVGRGAPPPLPVHAASVEVQADDLLTVLEDELHPISFAQWVH